MTLGQRIKKRRNDLNFTQDILAQKAGISKGFLSDIENGKRNIGAETLLKISDALGCSLDFIMKGTENEEIQEIQIEIPPKLAQFAQRINISFKDTLTLLSLRRQIIAHRSINRSEDIDNIDWDKFYESVKEFL